MSLNIAKIRSQFPILSEVIYLDNAATAQTPQIAIDAVSEFYEESNANVHRGLHPLAEKATEAYEEARKTVGDFINAKSPEEIIFTSGTTEGINLVARSLGESELKESDKIVLTVLEHHSNITPWIQVKNKTGAEMSWVDIDDEGNLKMDELDSILDEGNVKLVSVTGLSNVIGARPPIEEIIKKAHAEGAKVMIDAAQLAAHHQIDVQKLDCDFLAFSGHKVYGPMGIGVLYGKKELLESMPPFQTGGGMIRDVSKDGFICADLPEKFEAGTPPVAEAAGLKSALDWLNQFDWKDIEEHEDNLIKLAKDELSKIKNLTILGNGSSSGSLSFTVKGIHPHDLTDILGEKGICLRAGHHCAIPLHERLKAEASTRLSIGIYNTEEEIQKVRPAIEDAAKVFS